MKIQNFRINRRFFYIIFILLLLSCNINHDYFYYLILALFALRFYVNVFLTPKTFCSLSLISLCAFIELRVSRFEYQKKNMFYVRLNIDGSTAIERDKINPFHSTFTTLSSSFLWPLKWLTQKLNILCCALNCFMLLFFFL